MSDTNTNKIISLTIFPLLSGIRLMVTIITVMHHCSGNSSKCINNKQYILVFTRVEETKLPMFTDDLSV